MQGQYRPFHLEDLVLQTIITVYWLPDTLLAKPQYKAVTAFFDYHMSPTMLTILSSIQPKNNCNTRQDIF